MKVLLVGCGLTSTITAYLLHTRNSKVHLTLWDKARGPGGRTSVCRGPNGTFVDLGAQFITADELALKKYSDIYNLLISTKHLMPMTCKVEGLREVQGEQHFIAPNGTNSLVKHLLDNAKVDSVIFERRVSAILPTGNVKCTDGFEQTFDLIILTAPAPQLLELECPILSSVRSNLKEVTYSTRFTYNMFFDKKILDVNWDVKYLNDCIFRYISIDNRKRGQLNGADCVVFHTTKEFGQKNIKETKDSILNILNDKVYQLFPDWPQPVSCNAHKWLYSQVTNPYNNTPGCVVLNSESIPILGGGDSFTKSTFNGCIESAFKIYETVENLNL